MDYLLLFIRSKDSLAYKIYGKEQIRERHRHRYEINIKYVEMFEKNGLIFSGCDDKNEGRMEVIIDL